MSNPEISEPARSAALEFSHIIATMDGEKLAQRAIDLATAEKDFYISNVNAERDRIREERDEALAEVERLKAEIRGPEFVTFTDGKEIVKVKRNRLLPGFFVERTDKEQQMLSPLREAIEGKTSIGVTVIQRALGVGYTAAAQALELLEKMGWVGPADERGRREVLIGEEKASQP